MISLRRKPKPWIADSWDGGENIYVWPKDDLIDHEVRSEDCVCKPTVEAVFREDGSNGWMYTHSSLDGRENDGGSGTGGGRHYIQGRWVAGAFAALVAVQVILEVKRRR